MPFSTLFSIIKHTFLHSAFFSKVQRNEVKYMKDTGKLPDYAGWIVAEGLECTLCGKQGNMYFKKAVICEDCLEYVKNHY